MTKADLDLHDLLPVDSTRGHGHFGFTPAASSPTCPPCCTICSTCSSRIVGGRARGHALTLASTEPVGRPRRTLSAQDTVAPHQPPAQWDCPHPGGDPAVCWRKGSFSYTRPSGSRLAFPDTGIAGGSVLQGPVVRAVCQASGQPGPPCIVPGPDPGPHAPGLARTPLSAQDSRSAGNGNHDLQLLLAHMHLSRRLKVTKGIPVFWVGWSICIFPWSMLSCAGYSRICLLCRAGCALGRPSPQSQRFSVRGRDELVLTHASSPGGLCFKLPELRRVTIARSAFRAPRNSNTGKVSARLSVAEDPPSCRIVSAIVNGESHSVSSLSKNPLIGDGFRVSKDLSVCMWSSAPLLRPPEDAPVAG